MKAAAILDEIAISWKSESARQRDARIAIARSLREYVIAGLKERDAMGVNAAKRSGMRRERLIAAASDRLETRRRNINDAIGVVAVIDLLSLNGDLGDMAYKTIKFFIPLIERHKGSMAQNKDVPAEVSESWQIKGRYPQAVELFRRAVAERQSKEEIRRVLLETTKSHPSRNGRLRSLKTEDVPELDKVANIFRLCSARDACQQIKDMIVNSAEPLLLGEQLATYLLSKEFTDAVKNRELEERLESRRKKKAVSA
jgi:hypothetical protein